MEDESREPASKEKSSDYTEPKIMKKGRRRKSVTKEGLIAARQKRMEKNRLFAKEHRQRQKQYIASLEVKIANLEAQLAEANIRIGQYEMREHEKQKIFLELQKRLYQEIGRKDEFFLFDIFRQTQSRNLNKGEVIAKLNAEAMGRTRIIEKMTHEMLNYCLPLPYKLMLCHADCRFENEKIFNSSFMSFEYTSEEFVKLTENICSIQSRINESSGIRSFFKSSGLKLQKSARKFIKAQLEVQEQILSLNKFMIEEVMPKFEVSFFIMFVDWVQMAMKEAAKARLMRGYAPPPRIPVGICPDSKKRLAIKDKKKNDEDDTHKK
eukprot:TRINITY_DN4101_c0_g1_i4.p1 TRINITY_DN4101_c0_g1~~TRINITY_DN4101_c0_g1_i4.p1  ORF type:complete len:323 (-),score=88.76 TRINITY_DN4101_c0_g1_i4:188-1156(-)